MGIELDDLTKIMTLINQVWPPQIEGLGWDPQLQMLIILVVTVTWEGAHTQLIKTHSGSNLVSNTKRRYRQQVNGSSGTFDEILSNHSPGFTMSRVTSPKFPAARFWEGRVSTWHISQDSAPKKLDYISL